MFEFEGEVTPALTFDRPFVDGFDLGPSNQDVGYDQRTLEITQTGTWTITTETVFPADTVFWDGAILLYAGAFDPTTPETNLIAAAGVGGGTFDPSVVTLELNSTLDYTLVQTGVTSFDFGR